MIIPHPFSKHIHSLILPLLVFPPAHTHSSGSHRRSWHLLMTHRQTQKVFHLSLSLCWNMFSCSLASVIMSTVSKHTQTACYTAGNNGPKNTKRTKCKYDLSISSYLPQWHHSHINKKTEKLTTLCILICIHLPRVWKMKVFELQAIKLSIQ